MAPVVAKGTASYPGNAAAIFSPVALSTEPASVLMTRTFPWPVLDDFTSLS
jgi:hypothetical protein